VATWTAASREAYFKAHPENFAGPNKTYPIKDASDVEDAARLIGQAQNPDAVKRKLISIAKRLGLTDALPKAWMTRAQESIQIVGQILESGALNEPGHDVRVTVVKGGKSINGFYYDQNALQQIAHLIEGARAYADHGRTPADQSTRSVRDMVGFYKDAVYLNHDPETPMGRVDATLHIFEAETRLWSIIKEAVECGKPDLVGVSIDIFGVAEHDPNVQARRVEKVLKLNSCDVVTAASAGGAFQRILHDHEGEHMDPEDTLDGATPLARVSEDHAEKGRGAASGAVDKATLSPHNMPAQNILEQQRDWQHPVATLRASAENELARINEAETLLNELRLERAALLLERRLMESILPQAAQTAIRAKYAGRIFEAQELEREISSMQTMLAEMSNAGLIRDHGYEKPAIGQMITEAEKVQAAFDRMFDLDIDTLRLGNIRGFTSIREAYSRVTGDSSVASFSDRSTLGDIRVSESAPMTRISEADTTTASFSYLLGTSMNKRLLKDYQAWPAEWQKFCVIAPIKDFKQQSRVRLGAFGSLSTVAEDTAYTSITLTDSAATYVPTKRGNLVTVSRETIINDDLQAIKQIPTKLAVAAAYTLAEFVYSFLSNNPNIYDGNALFTSGAPHNNLGSSSLSSAAMQSGVTAMREQTNFAGKRLGLKPSYLIVPPELEWVAMVATKSAGVPGSANNDINPMLGYVQPIVSPQLTNTTQWFMACDPRVVDTIEIGFVGGQVNPVLLIQDMPLFGLNFTNDVISYKCRHEYGGAVLDFRGLYRGI
jgi:hypothetical protein